MTATSVYGIHIGDRFKDEDGVIHTVLEFLTPASHIRPWKVLCRSSEDGEETFEMEVHDLQEMTKI
jgi:hypothetical protein